MRFAGSRIEGLLGNGRTNFGAMAKADALRSNEIAAMNDLQGKVGLLVSLLLQKLKLLKSQELLLHLLQTVKPWVYV